MKIKIKSREEIEKTLESRSCHKDNLSCVFNPQMFNMCGEVLRAIDPYDYNYRQYTEDGGWHWHKDWYEVVEDFTEEDLMDIEFMDEMLVYFLSVRNN